MNPDSNHDSLNEDPTFNHGIYFPEKLAPISSSLNNTALTYFYFQSSRERSSFSGSWYVA